VRTDVVASWRAAAELELAPLLVLDPLARFLDGQGLGAGPIDAVPLGDGHSNITYLIRRAGGQWVLRRPPRPPFPASAHNVLREYRVLHSTFASGIRIAQPLAACDDEDVIGAPFYVMEHVEGAVLTTALPPRLDAPAERRRIGEELIDALAEIHAVDWQATGLRMLAPVDGYLDRQLRLFGRLWKQNRTRDIPLVERLGEHLLATRPASGPTTLVHGDYRLGNTIFGTSAPARLAAVLDWEMATLGDPLADVGYLTATWAEPDDATGALLALGAVTALPGFCSRAELIDRYAAVTGRYVESVSWYESLALWKAAIFLEGSYRRLLSGTTHDPFFAGLKAGVPELVERAWRLGNGEQA
jgi:aminoglycoside phosphotransferase (APT) family kinase protein